MAHRPSRFLTVFLTALSLIVGAAIVWRVISYSSGSTSPDPAVAIGDAGDARDSIRGDGAMLVTQDDATAAVRLPANDRASSSTVLMPVEPGSLTARELERRRAFERLIAKPPAAGGAASSTPPPAPRPVVTAPPPKTVVLPIPKVAPVKVVASAPKPSTQTQVQSQTQSGSNSNSTNTNPNTPERRDDDPNSDSIPPKVVSIQFVPAEVRDGESTVLTITASDNLSGVRSVSGTISSPTGALQGYACQREGDTDRFSTRISIPKDAADGLWNVSYVNLSDNASNSGNVTYVPPNIPQGASFRVTSSRPDASGPTLKAAWLDRPSIKAGERNTIFMQVDDDKSGVQGVSGIFASPAKLAHIGFNCQLAEGLNWQCSFSAPACLDCGTWQLEQVQLQDKANNLTTIRLGNPLLAPMHMDIFGDQCDATPPTMQSAVLDRNSVSNAVATTITLTVVASDNMCGVGSVSGHATGPSQPGSLSRIYFALSPAGDGQTWSGALTVPAKAPKGLWKVTWLQVLDKGYNLKAYGENDAILQGATFRVE
jgi:hypothetical protein